jgi:hypothetical protein
MWPRWSTPSGDAYQAQLKQSRVWIDHGRAVALEAVSLLRGVELCDPRDISYDGGRMRPSGVAVSVAAWRSLAACEGRP